MARANLAYSLVATAPTPAASGTTLTVTAGQGAYFLANSWITIWAINEVPTPTNAEIAFCTNVTGDTLTLTRAQQGTAARTIVVGDQIANTITVDDFTVLDNAVSAVSNALSAESAARVAADDALSNQVSVLSAGLSNETSARVAKDDTLSNAISALVLSIAVVSNAVSAEASSRLSADNQLSNTLSVETAARIAGDNALSTAVSALSAQLSLQISAISQAHSALSQAVSVADAALSVRVDTVSNAVSVLSAKLSTEISAISQAHSALSQAHSATSARLASVMSLLDGGTTGQVLKKQSNTDFDFAWDTDLTAGGGGASATVTSANISALSNRISILSAALSTQISAISQAHSALSQAVSVADAALSVRIDTVSNAVSVLSATLSTAVSALSQVHSVLSADVVSVKDRVSANSALISTVASALSVRIDTVSNAVSVLSATLSTAISAISQVHSALSADVVSLKDRVSSISAKLSTDISAISQAHSVLSADVVSLKDRVSGISAAVSSLSADVTSVKDRVSANSALISTVASALSVRIDTVSNLVSALTSAHNALSNTVSALSVGPGGTDQYLSLQNQDSVAVSAGAPVYLHNTVSGFGSFKLADASAISNPRRPIGLVVNGSVAISAVGTIRTRDSLSLTTAQWDAITGDTGGLSAGAAYYLGTTRGRLTQTMPTGANAAVIVGYGVTTTEMRLAPFGSVADWLSDSISVGTATAADLSNKISALSALISTQVSALSNVVSALTSAHNAVSNSVSILNAGLAPGGIQMKVAAGNQSISGTALANVSGLSISIAANGIYMVEGWLMHSMSGVSIYGFGLSLSGATMQNATWRFFGNLSVVATGTGISGLSTTVAAAGWGNEGGFGAATYSVLATQAGNLMTELKGLFALSTAGGTMQVLCKAGSSGCITIKAGSYIRAFKIG